MDLFAAWYAQCRGLLLHRVRAKWRLGPDVAEDVVHDAWVRVMEHIDQFDPEPA
jgi:DNA-directed RNA polymerase specialized sigma24 family protein